MSVYCECRVLSGRGLRNGLITRSVRCVWVWPQNLKNEEALADWDCQITIKEAAIKLAVSTSTLLRTLKSCQYLIIKCWSSWSRKAEMYRSGVIGTEGVITSSFVWN